MAIENEIRQMQSEGKSDQDITLVLQQKGYGIKEASDAVAQARIKQAVEASEAGAMTSQYSPQGQEMQQSIASSSTPNIQEEQQEAQPQIPPYPQEQYAQPQQPQQQYQDQQYSDQYQGYESYSSNTDMISEVAEQIVVEKISALRKQLESIIDLKTTTESKIQAIDERLKRLEKMIDRLQLSILQKVGEYVTNVEDIKKEMIETQKSFKSSMSQSTKTSQYKKAE